MKAGLTSVYSSIQVIRHHGRHGWEVVALAPDLLGHPYPRVHVRRRVE